MADWTRRLGALRRVLGTRSDWSLRPAVHLRPTRHHWVGPTLLVVSVLVGWVPFVGEPSSVGLWAGTTSIVLMAWSFLLAVRSRPAEVLFGGLARAYVVHRWAGIASVAAMALHTGVVDDVDGGIPGASRQVARLALGSASLAEGILWALVVVSVLRLVPYRWWRWTHKLLGVPFVLACWHAWTITKPYGNTDPWGLWFDAWMVAGTVAWVLRVGLRDAGEGSARYRVVAQEHHDGWTTLRLAPRGRPVRHRPGQFVFMRLGRGDLAEPHPFSVASGPDDDELELLVGELGDWSRRLNDADVVGVDARVEGSFGDFRPDARTGSPPTLWIAGGLGITPFLAAVAARRAEAARDGGGDGADLPRPVLLYASRDRDEDHVLEQLQEAHELDLVTLHHYLSGERRLTPSELERLFPDGLAGHHVALCGPAGMVDALGRAALALGAPGVEAEEYELRGGIGPSLSEDDWTEIVHDVRHPGVG